MNEQQIDEVLAKVQADPGGLKRSFLLTMSGFVPLLAAWAMFGKAGGFFAAVLGVPLALISHTFYLETKRPRASIIWSDFLRFYTDESGALSGHTHRFCERISTLYESDSSQLLLPFRHAARLLDTYHKQQARLTALNLRLEEVEALYQPLNARIEKLRELHETNEAGERTLRELRNEKRQLLALKNQIETSANNLEAILSTIENERKKRRLHQEVAVLAGRARISSDEEVTEGIVPDPVNELEEQITREIQTYLQLERDTDQRLSGV
jgi:hypothetical protein